MADHTGKVAATVISRTESMEKFLIAKRKDTQEWEFPGGKQHEDESILETAKREIKEELNLKINALEASTEYSYRSGGYNIVPVLASHEYSDPNKHIDLTDHSEYIWTDSADGRIPEDERRCLEAFDLV